MSDWGARDPAWEGIHDDALRVRGHAVHVLRHRGIDADEVRDGAVPPTDALPRRPLQLLVHGLGGSAHNWLDAIPHLARLGETIAPDLPGFGQTGVPHGGSSRVRANSGFLDALLEELRPAPVVLYGQSMGGLLAVLTAARRPANLVGLVLANPALPPAKQALLRQPPRVFARIIPAALPGFGRAFIEYGFLRTSAEDLIEDSLRGSLGPDGSVRPALRQALVDNAREARSQPWRRRAIAEAASSTVALHLGGSEIQEAVSAIEVPTLLVWGDADQLVSGHSIGTVVEQRPDWEQHVFGGVGHAPMLEVPDSFADVVTAWQREHVLEPAN